MKNNLKLIPLFVFLISCSKPIAINELKGEEGIAIDPETDQPYTGEAYLNYFDGQLRMKGLYEKGKKNGIWQYFITGSENRYYNISFKEGEIITVNYNESDQRWEGSPIAFHPDSGIIDGQYLVQERDVYNYSLPPEVNVQLYGNISQGTVTRWHGNGQIYSIGNFLNGEKHGLFQWWYNDGAKKEESNFDKGARVGVVTQWYQNGKKFAEANYKKGQLNGNLTWWYESGQKKEQTSFINGERDGYAYWWYTDGAKKGVGDISGGMGRITLFSPDGSVLNEFEVKNDQVFCNSGEIFFTIEDVSQKDIIPIGDGTCDCGDCSDEGNN
ncbi:MAG: toxin-antitoxin system YwqK family antitoxin [Candidatus Marinimicrobia bacterium]|nr:toxin-antitoxin system YwqK family antitoxin [Candidatus Neomarinimicrobiota bacterium]MBL7010795.1 toxin-antitoxin system YwqK family antitoxin [Candidatus Neomarinimicrobiota bacterium]MBL7031025.1 toxin-antitoxin system YwqK family antitoxin [Candidatus Neomarinimicrobiota bacterium]